MGILTRYVLRAHVAPFLFAFSVLTGMLFLNAVAQRLDDLAGKGLGWQVIAEFFVLSIPHIVALTLPMAILVAVLYTFSELTAGNEFTAMAAGGVRPQRLLLPVLGVGVILAGTMLFFNDRILPETNHRLKILGMDISAKSPTFQLREQVMNEIETGDGQGQYFLQAVEIDSRTSTLRDVAIYDLSDPTRHRTIYADRGRMAFNPEGTDLYLSLFDGTVYEVGSDEPRNFNRVAFQEQVIPLRGVADVLSRAQGETFRSDREMTIRQLGDAAAEKREELEEVRLEARTRVRYAVEKALGVQDPEQPLELRGSPGRTPGMPEGRTGVAAAGRGQPAPGADNLTRGVAVNLRTQATRAQILEMAANRYRVEIHKKYAIAFACFAFVLLGAPIGIRFPRGGVGMVISVSVVIFAIYWMGLIGGEKMADSGRMDPFWAMWTTDFLTMVLGLWLYARMGREVATNRGGGWEDLLATLRRSVRRPFVRLARAGRSAAG